MSLIHQSLQKSSSSVLRRSPRFTAGSHRRFSAESKKSPEGRLARTLYRGLLRWCDEPRNDVPLVSFVPPVYLSPPSIDESGLKALASTVAAVNSKGRSSEIDPRLERIWHMLPAHSIVEHHQLTVLIRNVSDVRGLLRALFRLHGDAAAHDAMAEKMTSLAFDTFKSLNELTEALQQLRKQREEHLDRTGVTYSVGQVVQHKYDRWRGVVIDWRRTTSKETDIEPPTSLTQKDYTQHVLSVVEDENKEVIEYSLVLDIGDAHLLGGKRQVNDQSGVPIAAQPDLQPVKEER